jgi:hypothetical protein
MPRQWRERTCAECGGLWRTRSATARTCSPKCRAVERERRLPSQGRPARQYPPHLVAAVRSMYESGLTRAEVQAKLPGYKVETVMRRHGITPRKAIPRDQTGSRNAGWKADEATYTALHLRVQSARGKPSLCEWCGETRGRFEWANLTGLYTDVSDYARLCVSCHRTYDAARRRQTGERTSPVRRSLYV